MPDELICLLDQWQDLQLLKSDKIDVVAFLSSFEKIIICPRQFFGYVLCLDVIFVKKTANTRML